MSENELVLAEPTPLAEANQGDSSTKHLLMLMDFAQKNPRRLHDILERSKEELTLNKGIAEKCIYSLPRGGKKIIGPSIKLAETLYSKYGYLSFEYLDVLEEETKVVVSARITDLQQCTSYIDTVTRSIVNKEGVRYKQDMVLNTIAAAKSILFRNMIFRTVGAPVVDTLFESVRGVIAGGETFADRRKKAIEHWKNTHKVTQAKLLKHLGHTQVSQITSDDIDYLIGLHNMIVDKETTVEEAFRNPMNPDSDANVEAMADEFETEVVVEAKVIDPETKTVIEEEEEPY